MGLFQVIHGRRMREKSCESWKPMLSIPMEAKRMDATSPLPAILRDGPQEAGNHINSSYQVHTQHENVKNTER